MSNFKVRNWCFTLNNPELAIDIDKLLSADTKYITFQQEKGENGTLHLQGTCS